MGRLFDDVAGSADALTGLIREAGIVTAFTGAGISTESGVPDFRSPGSPWMLNKPIPFQAFTASIDARREAWRRKFVMDDCYAGARPAAGHLALAALHATGKMPTLITQNIDGLHQLSGMPPEAVIELHGNGGYAKCLECGRRAELPGIRRVFEATGDAPRCEACGGLLKSATVSFGQAMPKAEMARATQAAFAADLFLAIGSSLVVFPAAELPRISAENGAVLAIVNREATPLDGLADIIVRADIGPVLGAVKKALQI